MAQQPSIQVSPFTTATGGQSTAPAQPIPTINPYLVGKPIVGAFNPPPSAAPTSGAVSVTPGLDRAAGLMSLLQALEKPGGRAGISGKPSGPIRGKPATQITGGPENQIRGFNAPDSGPQGPMIDAELNDVAQATPSGMALVEKFKQGTLSRQERKELTDEVTHRIFNHLGMTMPTGKITSQSIYGTAVPPEVINALKAQGVNVPDNATVNTVLTLAQQGAAGGGRQPSLASTGPETAQTADQTYLQWQHQAFNGPKLEGFTAQGQAWTQALAQAGYLPPNADGSAWSTAQVAAGYQALLKDAVDGKVPLGSPTSLNDPSTALGAKYQSTQIPGGAKSEVNAYITDISNEIGINLTPNQINALSNQFPASSGGAVQNPDAVKDAIIAIGVHNPSQANGQGLIAEIANGITKVAGEYGLTLNQPAAQAWALNNLTGVAVTTFGTASSSAIATYEDAARSQAEQQYPTLKTYLDSGGTVQQALQPYASIASSVLGVDPATVIASDPKWSAVFQQPDGKGGFTQASQSQAKQLFMQDPQYGFATSAGAREIAASYGTALLNMFGKVNTSGAYGQAPAPSNSTSQAYGA